MTPGKGNEHILTKLYRARAIACKQQWCVTHSPNPGLERVTGAFEQVSFHANFRTARRIIRCRVTARWTQVLQHYIQVIKWLRSQQVRQLPTDIYTNGYDEDDIHLTATFQNNLDKPVPELLHSGFCLR